MNKLSLLSPHDVQLNLANAIKHKRKALKLSRDALAKRSTVPAPTLKKFEITGQISLRQFILLWQSVDQLERLNKLTHNDEQPQSIEDVLRDA